MTISDIGRATWRFLRTLAPVPLAGAVLVGWMATAMAGAINIDKSTGLAIQGYDPVAYFTDDAAVKGSDEFTARHDGATYRFASAEHRDMFKADPAKFAPQYGGFCAYGIAKGVKAGVEPDQFTIVDGKLYLNYNASIQRTWLKDVPGHLVKSEMNWTELGAN